jgi:hypothetical protein
MGMKLILQFRDINQTVENYDLKFNIRNTPLAAAWCDLLIKNIFGTRHPIEKPYSLHGWQTTWETDTPRNLKYICTKLNAAIDYVNLRMKEHGYPHIDLEFTVEKLRSRKYQQLMNDIHHHFEILIGQSWNTSEWYKKADEPTRTAIRMLNNYCHEIEGIVAAINEQKLLNIIPFFDLHPGMSVNVGLNCPDFDGKYFLTKQKKEITLEGYECFTNEYYWGAVFIYYAQLGKTHLDAFNDKDKHIDKNNVSGWRYLTGEFVVNLPIKPKSQIDKKFKKWLKKNDFDINDKTLGIGFPVVADIETDQSRKKVAAELRLRNDLYQIRLEDELGNVVHSRIFDYSWQDQST